MADLAAPREHPVAVSYYMKHLMLYKDGRFAKHPCFHYFALNTEMQWCALQNGMGGSAEPPGCMALCGRTDMVASEGHLHCNKAYTTVEGLDDDLVQLTAITAPSMLDHYI